MSRLSRDKKRAQHPIPRPAVGAAPIEVHVPGDAAPGTGSAWVGGVQVTAAPGQEVQQAVLDHLHHLALTTGHPVLATIHDERIGYVVPLHIAPDGSSDFTTEPVRMAPPVGARDVREARDVPGAEGVGGLPEGSASFRGRAADVRPQWAHYDVEPVSDAEAPREQDAAPAQGGEPVRDEVPTFRMRVVGDEVAPTFALRALSDAPQAPAPGTVVPPTGEFGPPPVMDTPPASPAPLPSPGPMSPPGPMPTPPPAPAPVSFPDPAPLPTTDSTPTPTSTRTPAPLPTPLPDDLDAAPKAPTPPRGFDAVAEAVLGDELLTSPGDSSVPAVLAEPMGRISEAVKAGRTDAAAELAERTVAEASEALGPEHPEVLRLRELAAYIAYLAGDPAHAFRVSLDLAHIHHRTREAESAYGNIQSAATAWRAVRDPRQGLDLGRALIELWDELAAEDGPAADDRERLEAAHARMNRLTERARTDS
ncbi:tetratricopeptide repeat protein [Streptomyces lincolnensis]|uniref:tetratricopeptide repeat protein n=1 Tax=Streptomyces lincolnensis TaxID=1915 RepID=UPI001E2CFB25|nr:tetratricopeptide repeat protein [Streptomyces lincolnensis]MCD7444375.1 tetratricopeptide repeat protein [Streptomyces lincolnensis]